MTRLELHNELSRARDALQRALMLGRSNMPHTLKLSTEELEAVRVIRNKLFDLVREMKRAESTD